MLDEVSMASYSVSRETVIATASFIGARISSAARTVLICHIKESTQLLKRNYSLWYKVFTDGRKILSKVRDEENISHFSFSLTPSNPFIAPSASRNCFTCLFF